jgi:hypothetical protein
MDMQQRNGRWYVRWREGGRRRGRTFDRKSDAKDFLAWLRRRQQLGQAAVPDDIMLAEFVETYWRLHAVPNLSPATRELYGGIWERHILPVLGEYGVRELSPKRLTRFRAELEQGGVGTATVVKALTIVQSILSFAVSEEIVEFNAAAAVRKPRYTRAREPHIFLPDEVERIRAQLQARDRALVSVLTYSGPRPEEVVCRLAWGDVCEQSIRYVDSKRRRMSFSPLLPLSPKICANGSWPPGAPGTASRYSPHTTAGSGTATTGATGGSASGKASPSAAAQTGHARHPRGTADPCRTPSQWTHSGLNPKTNGART